MWYLDNMSNTHDPDPLGEPDAGFPESNPFSGDFDEDAYNSQAESSKGLTTSTDESAQAMSAADRASRADQFRLAKLARVSHRRRVRLPMFLFVATCLSAFWVGVTQWSVAPAYPPIRQAILAHWQDGLLYMGCLIGILLAHEMGHFIMTLVYRVPASFPYFIPFPFSPIGTMGAVIGMDGMEADRKEIFDIGLAGPLAGLVVALPVMWIGVTHLDLTQPAYGAYAVDVPWGVRLVFHWLQPTGYVPGKLIWCSQLNAYFMAGWVGLLVTGLNMLPVSQLDGGHVTYSLFGRGAHWIARGFILIAIAYIVIGQQWNWVIMLLLVLFIGPDHPPTRNDNVPIGRVRYFLGCVSLAIPVLCFAPKLMVIYP